jgi:DNA-binding NtrC family response regulator
LESELFGHERGAFTGAVERFAGRLEQANRGTVFLDEISELPYPMQAKLLRFLQSGEFQRLGAKETFHVDIRVVAATSKDLKALTGAGRFHEALYYRLNVIPLALPPLRERKDDIPLLVDHFVARFCGIYRRDVAVEPAVYDLLEEYPFPGNVRELENLIHRLVALAETDTIGIRDLPAEILKVTSQRIDLERDPLRWLFQVPPRDLEDLRRREECVRKIFAEQRRRLAEQAVDAAGGNVTEAASQIGVHRITLHKMLGKARAKPPQGTEQ